jgi:hypothetical protein
MAAGKLCWLHPGPQWLCAVRIANYEGFAENIQWSFHRLNRRFRPRISSIQSGVSYFYGANAPQNQPGPLQCHTKL